MALDERHTREKTYQEIHHPILKFLSVGLLGLATVTGTYGAYYIEPYLPVITTPYQSEVSQNQKTRYSPYTLWLNMGDSYNTSFSEETFSYYGETAEEEFVEDMNTQHGAHMQYRTYAQVGATSAGLVDQLDKAQQTGDLESELPTVISVHSGGNTILNNFIDNLSDDEIQSLRDNPFPKREYLEKVVNLDQQGENQHTNDTYAFLEKAEKASVTNPHLQEVEFKELVNLANVNHLYVSKMGFHIPFLHENEDISDKTRIKQLLSYLSQSVNEGTHRAVNKFLQIKRHIKVSFFSYAISPDDLTGIHLNKKGRQSLLQQKEATVDYSSLLTTLH